MRIALCSVLLAACSGGAAAPPDAKDCTVGDLSLDPEIELFYVTVGGDSAAMVPMGDVPLMQPIQGGYIFYVEPHLRNIDGCSIQVTTSLRDAASNNLVTFESRTISTAVDDQGWAVPTNEQNYGEVAACPQVQLDHNLYDQPYIVDLVAEDPEHRQAHSSVQVTPTCSEAFCYCQCNATYKLGDPCPGM